MVHITLLGTIFLAFALRKSGLKIQSIPFIILCTFASLRYDFGNDYMSYYKKYKYIHATGKSYFDEYLFTFLNKISPSFYIMIAIISVAFVFIVWKMVKANVKKEYIWVSVFIFVISPYLFLMNLSAIRQCLAMLLFIISVKYIIDKNFIKYAVCIIIGCFFHKSAVILLPIYFFINTKKLSKKQIFIIVTAVIVLITVFDFNNFMIKIAILFDDTNYMHYATSGLENSIRATLLASIYMIYVLLNTRKVSGDKSVYVKLYLIGTIFGVLAFRFSILTRIQMYFDIFAIVAIPAIMEQIPMTGYIYIKRNKPVETIMDLLNRYALPCCIVLIYCLRYYSFFNNSLWDAFKTYKTIIPLL